MSEAARDFIKKYCEDNHVSTRMLEKRTGVPAEAIYGFLSHRLKDIKLSTATKICNEIGCSLDELAGRATTQHDNYFRLSSNVKLKIMEDVMNYLIKFINKSSFDVSLKEFNTALNEIYVYCSKKDSFDKDFAEWWLVSNLTND